MVSIKNGMSRMMVLSLTVMLLVAFTTTYAAADEIKVTSDGHSFKKAWESDAYDTGTHVSYFHHLTYGYNTAWVNEDYAISQGTTINYDHKAYVKNANGVHYGDKVGRVFVSRIEVRHSGNNIIYKAIYNL